MGVLRAEAVDDLLGRITHDVDAGLLPAAQVALCLDGDLVLHEAWGCSPRARMPMYSTSKVFTAAATWRLVSEGRLSFDTPVIEVLPWFDGGGKGAVTVRHLLAHTAGLHRAQLREPTWFDPDDRRRRMAAWVTSTAPGARFDYHPLSAAWVLAEILSELRGESHTSVVHDLVTGPMGLPPMLGIDDTAVEVVDLVPVVTGDDGWRDGAAERALADADDDLLRFNDHDVRALGVPGGGGLATAADVARLYQHLLHDPRDLFDPDVLRAGTQEIAANGLDDLRGCPAHRTLGLVLAGDDGHAALRGFGSAASRRAFGHDGAAGQVAFADPATGLSVCFLANALGADQIPMFVRAMAVATRAAACVHNG